jgi:hypothetical protein
MIFVQVSLKRILGQDWTIAFRIYGQLFLRKEPTYLRPRRKLDGGGEFLLCVPLDQRSQNIELTDMFQVSGIDHVIHYRYASLNDVDTF